MNRKKSSLLKFTFWNSLFVGSLFVLAGCGSSETINTAHHVDRSASQYAQQVVNLGPQAQEACVSAGGLPSLNLELNGAQTAVCQFANGKRCSEQALIDGACIPG